MFDLSKEDVLRTIDNYDKILERVYDVANEIGFLTEEFDTFESDKTEFSKDTVYIRAFDSHYDMYDSTSGSFPIDFLFEDAEQHKDWYKNKREQEQKQKELREEQRKREQELKELARLKEKYE